MDIIQAIFSVETAKGAINEALRKHCDDISCSALEVESDILNGAVIEIWLNVSRVKSAGRPDSFDSYHASAIDAINHLLPEHEAVWDVSGESNWIFRTAGPELELSVMFGVSLVDRVCPGCGTSGKNCVTCGYGN